jgi:hypothetical protein
MPNLLTSVKEIAALPEAFKVHDAYVSAEKSAVPFAVLNAVVPKLSKSPAASAVFDAGAEE